MKRLNDHNTPETDELYAGDNCSQESHARDLERRLAACREALAIINNSVMTIERIEIICAETLILTAPKQ